MSNASIISSLGSGVCSIDGPTLGLIITGSGNTFLTNIASARNTDIVLSFCGHVGILVVGSSNVNVNSLQKTKIGSVFTGVFTGTIITGVGSIDTGG